MSLKSLLGFSAAVGALAVFATACSAAPDGSPTATESSNEALTRICPPPPIPYCSPVLAEEGRCPGPCPGGEWSSTLCRCVFPDAGSAVDSGACTTPEPVGGCGPLRLWNPATCTCVPTICPADIVCPLEGAAASTDPTIIRCCGPICTADIVCPLEGAAASTDPTIIRCCGPILSPVGE